MANIRTACRSGLVFRGGRNRRETLWVSQVTTETVLAGAPTVAILTALNAAGLALRPFTVIRDRGVIHLRSDQAGATETYGVGYGKCVVSDQAVLIGVTAVPTPVTDKSSDLWYLFESLFGRIEVSSGAGTGVPTETGKFLQYDSKAMRKVEEGQDLISVVENEISGCNVVVTGRTLIKLH